MLLHSKSGKTATASPASDTWAGTAYVVSFPHPVYLTLEQPSGYWDFVDLELRRDRRPPLLGNILSRS